MSPRRFSIAAAADRLIREGRAANFSEAASQLARRRRHVQTRANTTTKPAVRLWWADRDSQEGAK